VRLSKSTQENFRLLLGIGFGAIVGIAFALSLSVIAMTWSGFGRST